MQRLFVSIYGLSGAAAVTLGIYMWSVPAALIFAGAFVMVDAWRTESKLQ